MWRNWNPLNPPINHQSSEEENGYESPQGNELDPNELVSPHRPHQSVSASPRALLRPDPPPVDQVLADVGQRLRELPDRQQRAANRNAVREAQAAAEAAEAASMVNYDTEDKADGEKAQDLARSIKVEFDPNNIKFWFAQLEDEMEMATINRQWLKKAVLQRNLPLKIKEDVMGFLQLQKAEAGAHIYLDIKRELLRIYAPKPQDAYNKALARTMAGLPSQLGYQIINDICQKPVKLEGCCCAGAALAIWSNQLPINIRAHISNMTFDKNTYKSVFEAADRVFNSARQSNVAVAAITAKPSLDETQSAFSPQNQPSGEVAAYTKSQNGQNGGKNKKNKNKNQNQNKNQSRGKKHSSVPEAQADKMCDRHYRHGASAWYCLNPSSCPWADKVTPKP